MRRFYAALSTLAVHSGERTMDLLYIGLAFAFFAASVALVHGFERLRKPR
jgi:hypothetical protein